MQFAVTCSGAAPAVLLKGPWEQAAAEAPVDIASPAGKGMRWLCVDVRQSYMKHWTCVVQSSRPVFASYYFFTASLCNNDE